MEPFVVPVSVRFRDCDPMGHVNNAVYLTYFEVARAAWMQQIQGTAELPFILAEATVTFRSPAVFGEVLQVALAVESIGSKSWRFGYKITAETGREVAVGSTAQVAYDYAASKTVPIPDTLRRQLEGLLVAQ